MQLNGLQVFNICENEDGPAYVEKARMALSLDKVDLVEGGYPVDAKKYPHVPPPKGKKTRDEDLVDEDEVEVEEEEDFEVGELPRDEDISAQPPPQRSAERIIDSDDETDDEDPPLQRRPRSRAPDEASPSFSPTDIVDEFDGEERRPSSAPSDLERVRSPARKKAKKQQQPLPSPAQSRSPPGGSSPSVEDLVTRLRLQEEELAMAQAAALKATEDALRRQEEATRIQLEQAKLAEQRQEDSLAKQAEHYKAEMKRNEEVLLARMEAMLAAFMPTAGANPSALPVPFAAPSAAPSELKSTPSLVQHSSAAEFPVVPVQELPQEPTVSPVAPPPLPGSPPPPLPASSEDVEMLDSSHRDEESEPVTPIMPRSPQSSSGGHLNDL